MTAGASCSVTRAKPYEQPGDHQRIRIASQRNLMNWRGKRPDHRGDDESEQEQKLFATPVRLFCNEAAKQATDPGNSAIQENEQACREAYQYPSCQ